MSNDLHNRKLSFCIAIFKTVELFKIGQVAIEKLQNQCRQVHVIYSQPEIADDAISG